MGGDTPFVETSAATGKGIDELLDHLSVVAELKELKANPNKPARGTCLEANLSEGEGVQATLLVRDGTLRKGDVILCGRAYGRIRQMYNDMGKPLEEAGPSVPVRITGLDRDAQRRRSVLRPARPGRGPRPGRQAQVQAGRSGASTKRVPLDARTAVRRPRSPSSRSFSRPISAAPSRPSARSWKNSITRKSASRSSRTASAPSPRTTSGWP